MKVRQNHGKTSSDPVRDREGTKSGRQDGHAGFTGHSLANLHRTIGNQAVGRLIRAKMNPSGAGPAFGVKSPSQDAPRIQRYVYLNGKQQELSAERQTELRSKLKGKWCDFYEFLMSSKVHLLLERWDTEHILERMGDPVRENARAMPDYFKSQRAREEQKQLKRPKLHRGNSFKNHPGTSAKGYAIHATMRSFFAQLPPEMRKKEFKHIPDEENTNDPKRIETYKSLFPSAMQSDDIFTDNSKRRPEFLYTRLDKPSKDSFAREEPEQPLGQELNSEYEDRGHLATNNLLSPERRATASKSRNIITEGWLMNQGYKRGLELAAQHLLELDYKVVYFANINYESPDSKRPQSVIHSYVVQKPGQDDLYVVSVELMNNQIVDRQENLLDVEGQEKLASKIETNRDEESKMSEEQNNDAAEYDDSDDEAVKRRKSKKKGSKKKSRRRSDQPRSRSRTRSGSRSSERK
jgi:hypothetical protein